MLDLQDKDLISYFKDIQRTKENMSKKLKESMRKATPNSINKETRIIRKNHNEIENYNKLK